MTVCLDGQRAKRKDTLFITPTCQESIYSEQAIYFEQTMQILDFSMRSPMTKSSDGWLLCKVSILISNIVKAKATT